MGLVPYFNLPFSEKSQIVVENVCSYFSILWFEIIFLCNYHTFSCLDTAKLVKLFVIETKLSLEFVLFSNRMWT
jgi:hypothetical protein